MSLISKIFVIAPKISACFSFIGSGLIVRDILGSKSSERKTDKMAMRVMLGLSIGDLMTSFIVHFLGTWLVPASTGAYLASGNMWTCTFQGFVGKFVGQISTFYNVSLIIVYILIIRYNWKERHLRNRRSQFLFLGLSPLVSLALAIPPVFDDAYNWTGLHQCYIASVPLGCSGNECERGEHAVRLDLWLSTNQLIAVNVLLLLLTLLLVWTVFQTERRNDRYLSKGQSRRRISTREASVQGLLYVLAFIFTYFPWYVLMFMRLADKIPSPGIIVWTTSSISAQGFFNAIVYFRPSVLSR